jgi:hypothetical protein
MSDQRITCRCGKRKVSAWDGKCGHCRSKKDVIALRRMQDEGWTREEAELGYRMRRPNEHTS